LAPELEVILMQEPGAGDDSRFRTVEVDEIGDMPEQRLDGYPYAGFEPGIEDSVLLL
jgi:hypothetical protein